MPFRDHVLPQRMSQMAYSEGMSSYIRDFTYFVSSMALFLSSLGLTMLGIPQCGLHDTSGCVHE